MGEASVAITEDLVRDALMHLYDNAHLREHPLLPLLVRRRMPDPLARTQHMRNLIIQVIHDLKPPSPIMPRSREWRPYGILVYRYLDGMTDEQIQRELGISERQFFRDLKAGVELLTLALQARYGRNDEEQEADALVSSIEGMGLFFERLDLNRLGREVIELLENLAKEHGKGISWRPAPHEAVAVADAALSRQALISLLAYALRHARGDVGLDVISSPEAQALFLRYALAEPVPSEPEEEALSRARRLLEQQGGLLRTHRGSGGEQLVGLHWRRFEEPPVLIVDDNPGMLRLFARYLAGHGYRIVSTAEGTEAVALASENEVRLVVLDVMMRGMDGWVVLQQLREDPRTRHIPVLVCSVINEPDLARTLGASRLLKKPVTREQLLDAVAEMIGI